MDFEVTKMGERGQIVIPQEFRKNMKLESGDKFMVFESADMLIFKKMTEPSIDEFHEMLKKAQNHAKKYNLTEKDIKDAIKDIRSKK